MKKNNYIPLSEPYLNGKEIKYTKKCFQDNWVSSSGPYIKDFEKRFASFLGAKYAVACSSGTAALHLALKAIGILENEIVIVSNLTFIATVNAVRYINAEPILIDADIENWQMDVKVLEKFLKNKCVVKNKVCIHKQTKKKISAILVTHILGYSCNVSSLLKIAKKYNIILIEDAAEALGSKFNKKFLGTFGICGCFSFNGNKTITTGSGGMLVTNSTKLAKMAKHLSEQAKILGSFYKHSQIGFNYRMSNIQAAMGMAQISDLNFRIKRKREIFGKYKKELSHIKGLSFPKEVINSKSSFWLTSIRIDKKILKIKATEIIKQLARKNIEARLLWEPMNQSKPHKNLLYYGQDNSKKIYNSSVSLPSSVGLKDKNQKIVIEELKKIIKIIG